MKVPEIVYILMQTNIGLSKSERVCDIISFLSSGWVS